MIDIQQRRIHVESRLEELGGALPWEDTGADLNPSWGEVGSLARAQMPPEQYAHLLALHEDMLALERSRRADDQPGVVHPVRRNGGAPPSMPVPTAPVVRPPVATRVLDGMEIP